MAPIGYVEVRAGVICRSGAEESSRLRHVAIADTGAVVNRLRNRVERGINVVAVCHVLAVRGAVAADAFIDLDHSIAYVVDSLGDLLDPVV